MHRIVCCIAPLVGGSGCVLWTVRSAGCECVCPAGKMHLPDRRAGTVKVMLVRCELGGDQHMRFLATICADGTRRQARSGTSANDAPSA